MLIKNIKKRTIALSNNWPNKLRDGFRNYLKFNSPIPLDEESSNFMNFPFWYKLIQLKYDDFSSISKSRFNQKNFLEDLIWAQFCIILTYRIKDDLFDAHLQNNSLIVIPDLLLVESYSTYYKHFKNNKSFWNFYFNSIKSSILAAIKADEIQQNHKTPPDMLLELYENMLSLFNIGIVALCEKFNCNDEKQKLLEINQNILLAGQILDDLEDIQEDFSRGRYNYVLLKFTNSNLEMNANQFLLNEILVEQIVRKGNLSNIAKTIYELIDRSKSKIDCTKNKNLCKFIQYYLNFIILLKNQYHKERVNLVFENLLNSKHLD